MKLNFWTRLKEQIEQTTGTDVSSAGSAPENPLLAVLEPLEKARTSALGGEAVDIQERLRAERRQAAWEEEQRRMAQHRQEMLEDVVHLHHQLGTGLRTSDLERLSSELKATLELLARRGSDTLADRGLAAAVRSVHDEAMMHGWAELERRLKEAGMALPPPSGLASNATPDEVQHKTELHTALVHEDFLHYDLKLIADLILGVVPAWRSVYPERHSPVWEATCYQAVGGALAIQKHALLVEQAQQNVDAIRRLLAERLGPALAPIQSQLQRGVSSLSEAQRLSEEASRICEKLAPEALWEILAGQQAHA